MFSDISYRLKKFSVIVIVLFTTAVFTSCGQKEDLNREESPESQTEAAQAENNITNVQSTESTETAEAENTEKPENNNKKLFGENCISEQTFEVELSAYDGKVYFVPYAPFDEEEDFGIEIIQDGEVLTKINAYVPEELTGEKFGSLDAVSFYDVNYDGNTDIVLIETYGDTSFAAVYYGFGESSSDYDNYFAIQDQLSEALSSQVETVTIQDIRSFLTEGKKNGEFSNYQEAYKAVSRLCDLESSGEEEYNLIYFDDDDIPELAAGVDGYYMSLYTYQDGTVYTLMDRWAYGAMGNAGYEYCPKKNSMRNYNSDYAGAVLYTTYMAVNDQNALDVVAQIKILNFDDVNGNGMPDENETDSIGYYSTGYDITDNEREITNEEYTSYDLGEYEYIGVDMSLETLWAKL